MYNFDYKYSTNEGFYFVVINKNNAHWFKIFSLKKDKEFLFMSFETSVREIESNFLKSS